MFKRKDNSNGSNRRTEADPSDPGTSRRPNPSADTSADKDAGTSTGEGPSEPLIETIESDTPILAKREANLYLGSDMGAPFITITNKGAFGLLAKALCYNRSIPSYGSPYNREERHSVYETPNINCQCGFYAIPLDAPSQYSEPYRVTLLVELSGKVIEHSDGYRGEYQRVVECQVPPCNYCGAAADHLLLGAGMETERFVCDAHTTTLDVGFMYLDIPSLERRIGVSVSRLELPWPIQ